MNVTGYEGGGVLQLTLLFGFLALFLIPYILFLITQQNTLKAIQPENRTMSPGEVWLQLIPLFGFVWQFFVVTRISDSLRKEFISWSNDTIFRAEGRQTIDMRYSRPTYGIGLAMCISSCCFIIPILNIFALLGALVCWIIYWVQLADYKSRVQRRFY